MPNSSYTPQEKVTWYNETGSTTTVRRKFRSRYQRIAPSRNKMVNWVQNFELRGNAENQNGSGRPSITPQTIKNFSSYFQAHRRRSL